MNILYEPTDISWEVKRGNSYFVVVQYIDTNEPLDLSVFELSGDISLTRNTSIPVPINIIDAKQGIFEIDFSSEFTASLGKKNRKQILKYNINVTTPEHQVLTVITGSINVSE